MPSVSLESVVSCSNLPSLPSVAMKVVELARNKNVRMEDITTVVEKDPALAGKILKTVNSSYYGLTKPCPSIARAVAYLGLNTVKALVLGFSLVDWTAIGSGGFDLISYWRRCIYSAAAARRIALNTKACDPDEAFVAALMQDIGMLAMYAQVGDRYLKTVGKDGGYHNSLPQREKEAYGFDHTQVGAALGEKWRLPDHTVDAIRVHHEPTHPKINDVRLLQVVILSTQAAAALSTTTSPADVARFKASAKRWFNLSGPSVDGLLVAFADDATAIATMFKVATGKRPDVKTILAEAQEASAEHQLAVMREADQLRQSNEELSKQATTDALTDVGNRKKFDLALEERYGQAKSFKASLAVIMIDADKFKTFNDTHGHQAGDAVLVELARRMTAAVGESGLVCRYGGEEFAIIATGCNRTDAAALAEKVRGAVAGAPFDLRQAGAKTDFVPVTISLGVAVYEPETAAVLTTPAMVVKAADQALYAAKQSGRNCVRVINPKPRAEAA